MKQYKTFFLKVGGEEKAVYEIIFLWSASPVRAYLVARTRIIGITCLSLPGSKKQKVVAQDYGKHT